MLLRILVLSITMLYAANSNAFSADTPGGFIAFARVIDLSQKDNSDFITPEDAVLTKAFGIGATMFVDGVLRGYVGSFGNKASTCYYKHYANSADDAIQQIMATQYKQDNIDPNISATDGVISIIKNNYPMPAHCRIKRYNL